MGTDEASEIVQPILDNVRENGAAALREYAEKFDHIVPKSFRVPTDVMDAAVACLDPEVRAAVGNRARAPTRAVKSASLRGLPYRFG